MRRFNNLHIAEETQQVFELTTNIASTLILRTFLLCVLGAIIVVMNLRLGTDNGVCLGLGFLLILISLSQLILPWVNHTVRFDWEKENLIIVDQHFISLGKWLPVSRATEIRFTSIASITEDEDYGITGLRQSFINVHTKNDGVIQLSFGKQESLAWYAMRQLSMHFQLAPQPPTPIPDGSAKTAEPISQAHPSPVVVITSDSERAFARSKRRVVGTAGAVGGMLGSAIGFCVGGFVAGLFGALVGSLIFSGLALLALYLKDELSKSVAQGTKQNSAVRPELPRHNPTLATASNELATSKTIANVTEAQVVNMQIEELPTKPPSNTRQRGIALVVATTVFVTFGALSCLAGMAGTVLMLAASTSAGRSSMIENLTYSVFCCLTRLVFWVCC